jgi:hypothetical protein
MNEPAKLVKFLTILKHFFLNSWRYFTSSYAMKILFKTTDQCHQDWTVRSYSYVIIHMSVSHRQQPKLKYEWKLPEQIICFSTPLRRNVYTVTPSLYRSIVRCRLAATNFTHARCTYANRPTVCNQLPMFDNWGQFGTWPPRWSVVTTALHSLL